MWAPEPEKKISKKNNPKMTFDKMCREKWIFIARSHGLEIEYTPKPRDEQLDPIVDLFAAAFANSNKAIKDGYDSQSCFVKLQELLPNIAGIGNVRQCCNFTKAPLKMPSSVTITS